MLREFVTLCLHVWRMYSLPSASPSTDYTVTAQQLIKGWNKTRALHRQSSEIRKWLIWGFLFPPKQKKNSIWLHLFSPPLGYIHSKQHSLIWELSAEAAVQTSPRLYFHFSNSGQCFRKGSPSSISLRSFQWSVTYTWRKKLHVINYQTKEDIMAEMKWN